MRAPCCACPHRDPHGGAPQFASDQRPGAGTPQYGGVPHRASRNPSRVQQLERFYAALDVAASTWSGSVAAARGHLDWEANELAHAFHRCLQAHPDLVGEGIHRGWVQENYPLFCRWLRQFLHSAMIRRQINADEYRWRTKPQAELLAGGTLRVRHRSAGTRRNREDKLMAKRKGKNLSVPAKGPKYEGRNNTKKTTAK